MTPGRMKEPLVERLQTPDGGKEERRRSLAPAQNPQTTLKISQGEKWQLNCKQKYINSCHNKYLHLIRVHNCRTNQTHHPVVLLEGAGKGVHGDNGV